MAERPKGYGMTAELQAKKQSKYDPELEKQARDWMEKVVGEPLPSADFQEALKNGEYLCKLANQIQPGAIKKINTSKMAFKMMENIGYFLSFCENYGCVKEDLFQTVDLFEGENIPQVILGIHTLGRKVQSKNPSLPSIGPKELTKNKRHFSEEQLEAGKGVIGLQMGSNEGASQSGMTPYGLGRQIDKTNLKI